MPKAGKRRRRGNPETETAARKKKKKKKKKTTRSLAEDRSLTFAAFQSEEAKPQAKLVVVYYDVDSSPEEESSSCPPSPLLHRPYIPDELADNPDVRVAFHLANTEYHADRACRSAVLDCYSSSSSSCLSNNPSLLHIREPAKDAVLLAADSVIVHLLDGETAVASLLYLQEHYEFALYEVVVDKSVRLSTFNDNVHSGQDVFRLGRDESLDLRITHGRVEYKIPTRHERRHYMYFFHDGRISLHDDGGPVIDLEGRVVGMVNNQINEAFLPSSILHKCLDSWRKLKCTPRAHLGMTFTSIKLLDPICIERMRRKHNIASGLIVEQVSKESNAEKLGIRMAMLLNINGEYISSATELEKMLLDIGGDHFDQANVLNGEIDVRIQIFRATKRCRRVRNLTVIVSDCGEDIIEGTYPITDGL
ncbi:hypothetical protein ZWY2020_051743 [Hordeum vulgare]|nr:hypothetical protein ZWY2020_051743 [Hordeum vulgare]